MYAPADAVRGELTYSWLDEKDVTYDATSSFKTDKRGLYFLEWFGIAEYDEHKGDYLYEDVIGDADAGDDGYVTIGEMLDDDVVKSPNCPICHQPMQAKNKVLHSKGQKYTFHFNCKKDGDMLLVLRLRRNFNETWRAKRTIAFATEESLEELQKGLERTAVRRKMRQRKSRGPRRPSVEKSENS